MAKIKNVKQPIAIFLSIVICFSACILSNVFVGASGEEPINVVYSDDFSAETLSSDWAFMANGEVTNDNCSYTSEIENEMLRVNTNKATRSATAGCVYLPGKERINQRVAVEFEDLQVGNNVYVYARLNKTDRSDWKSLTGYYVRYSPTDGYIKLYKINETSNDKTVMNCGKHTNIAGEKYRLELVATGTDQTVLTVRMLKITDISETVITQNTYIDTDSPFIKGTAGIAVSGSSKYSVTDYAYLDNFTYTSTDNVSGNKKYLSHLCAVDNNYTFGQVVPLESGVEYVFAAYGTVDIADGTGYKNEPLWVEYQTSSSANVASDGRLVTSRAQLKKTCDLTTVQCRKNNLEYSEYNVTYVTFTAGGGTASPYVADNMSDRVKHIVGVRLNSSSSLVGNYSYFTLYRKDDTNRTNLLVNPDFKMGLYGWADNMNKYYGYSQGVETNAVDTANSYVTLLSDKNNYEYYDTFKNTSYETLEDDSNRDERFDIRDLVFAANTENAYYYLVDYNKDGNIDGADLQVITTKLLSAVTEETEIIIGYDNDSADDDNFAKEAVSDEK